MKYLYQLTGIALLFFFTLNGNAQIISSALVNEPSFQYKKAEWEIKVKGNWSNPYAPQEVALDMFFSTPSGQKLVLPCYFESGMSGQESRWKARFTPREKGTYTYHFEWKEKQQLVQTTKTETFDVKASKGKGFLSVNDLWTLRYDNGELFRGIGENICWESRDADDSKYFEALHEDKRFNYDYMLKKLADNGGNFFRTWMIYWNLPIDWKTVNNNSRYQNTTSPYNESGMEHMDRLVELCDSLTIHMMLALESHVGYMGLGWETSNYNITNGGYAKNPLEFFTLPEAKQQYKNKLRLMVARYGYSPAIGAWEFFNEIDNAMYHGKPEDRIPDAVITQWHDEMSSYLKSIDPFNHIVTTSISHRDVEGMNDLKNIDINQKHIYKHTVGIPATLNDYSKKHNKPYVIGESGYEWDWSKNFNDFATEMDNDFKLALWLGLFNPTPVLPMSWWWEFFENRGMMSYFNRVNEMNRTMLDAGKGKLDAFNVETGIESIMAFGVKAGNKHFIYLYNTGENAESIVFTSPEVTNKIKGIRYFDTETGSYTKCKITPKKTGTIELKNKKLQSKKDLLIIW